MVNRPKTRLDTLRKRSDFKEILAAKNQVSPCFWLILAYRPNNSDKFRYGWTIPKYVGVAVVRNRLRRWCRDFFGNFSPKKEGEGYDFNIIFRRAEKEFYKNVRRQDLFKALSFAQHLFEKKTKRRNR